MDRKTSDPVFLTNFDLKSDGLDRPNGGGPPLIVQHLDHVLVLVADVDVPGGGVQGQPQLPLRHGALHALAVGGVSCWPAAPGQVKVQVQVQVHLLLVSRRAQLWAALLSCLAGPLSRLSSSPPVLDPGRPSAPWAILATSRL